MRLTRSYDPWVRAAWVEGQRTPVPPRIRRSRFLAQHVDLDVDFHVGPRVVGFRVVGLPGRKMQGNPQTRLTDLAHEDVSRAAALLGYRGGATDASQSVVISSLESISAFSERRGHR